MCPERINFWDWNMDWTMKTENLHSLERRAERMMVRWMGGVVEGQEAQCGFTGFVVFRVCGVWRCAEAWQIEAVWTFGA